MNKYAFFAFSAGCLLFQALCGFGQTSNFLKGEALLMQNKPGEAAVFLENSLTDDPAQVKTYLYLGIVYEQLNRADEAIAAYRKILDRAGDMSAVVANNLGNAYFQKGDSEAAEEFYSRAISADSGYASAYLGRANTRITLQSMRDAVADYEQYLALQPGSPQRPAIERLIGLIRAEFAAEERRRLLAEEQARAEAERTRLEAERKQRLLEEVAASLQSAADSSKGVSSGHEEMENYDSEFELE
jgi:tetratricopeptide (TPR) repeat protein